jgi:hydrogenase/urease accessory protein HupE
MRGAARLIGAAGAALSAGPAAAHGVVPALGPFYSGLLHPVLEPALGLALLAAGLWWGMGGGGPQARRVGAAFGLALLAGLALQALLGLAHTTRLWWLLGAVLGALVAGGARLPAAVAVSLAGVLGLAVGWGAGVARLTGSDAGWLLAGTALASLGLPAWAAALVQVSAPRAGLRPARPPRGSPRAVRALGAVLAVLALGGLAVSFAPAARQATSASASGHNAGK